MSAHHLENLYERLGKPTAFWPLVMFVLFVVLPLLASAADVSGL